MRMQPGFNGNKLEAFNLYRQPARRGDEAPSRPPLREAEIPILGEHANSIFGDSADLE